MNRLSVLLVQLLPVVMVVYLCALGGTWNGVLLPDVQKITLGMFGAVFLLWRLVHWRGNWRWHLTPFDLVFVGWGVCVMLSVLANPTTWRLSAEAGWYLLLYAVVWYALADAFSNGMPRTAWVNALLITGVVQVLIAGLQMQSFYGQGGTGLARVVGTFGNPNTLGAFLVVLLPLIGVRIAAARNLLERVVLALFLLAALLVLLSTYSRGAWVGTAVAALTLAGLAAVARGLTSRAHVRQWWQGQTPRARQVWIGVVLAGMIAVVVLIVGLVASLSVGGRSADLRTNLWSYAVQMFTQSPVVGKGLFTYGTYLPTFWSIPPQQPHAHPHNLFLLILAELGVVGVVMVVISVAIGVVVLRLNWIATPARHRLTLAAYTAALVGYFTHHLLDTPAMQPAVALVGVLMLALALIPVQPQAMQARWRIVGHPMGMAVASAALIAVGVWQSGIQTQYLNVLEEVIEDGDYAAGAAALAPVVTSDPSQPAYRLQQAYFYGMAAVENPEFAANGETAYAAYLALQPNNAAAWANRAALAAQQGKQTEAITFINEAIRLAPEWEDFRHQHDNLQGGSATAFVPVESAYAPNTAYYQYLRYLFTDEMLPQMGWVR